MDLKKTGPPRSEAKGPNENANEPRTTPENKLPENKERPKKPQEKPAPKPRKPEDCGGEPSSSSKPEWGPVSAHPDMKQMMEDQTMETEQMGTFRVALKPQSKRSPIAVLMHRKQDEKKFTQKTQIVVKPGVLAVDAMCILKLIAVELAEKSIDMKEIKERRGDLLKCLEDSAETLLLSMQVRHPPSDPGNVAFLEVYQRRIDLEIELAVQGKVSGRSLRDLH